MRVLLVSHGYPPTGVAGVERLTAQLAGELDARGHAVAVYTRQPDEVPRTPMLRRELRDGIPVNVVIGGGSTFGLFPGREGTMEGIFERLLVEFAPDIVLCAHLLHHSPGYVEIAHRWGVPIVLELHDFFMQCPLVHLRRVSGALCDGPEGGHACAVHCFGSQEKADLRWSLRARSFADALEGADEVLAPSPYVVEAFAPLRGEERPIRVVPNAVARMGPMLGPERPEGAPLRLASIGVTVQHKGFQVVVDAIRQSRLAAIAYTIFGVALPPTSEYLREIAAHAPGLELRLAGGYKPEQLPVMLADTDIVVVPSIVAETYSIVAREAFANGIPVIASDIGALPEAIRPEENGWLVPPNDAPGLAALLTELDADRARIRRAAAGIRLEDWVTLDRRTDLVEDLLAEVVGRGPRRPRGEIGEPDEVMIMREALGSGAPRA